MHYVIGLRKNARLLRQCELAELALADQYRDRPRRVIARLEHGPQGANPRFIVTSLAGQDRRLYEQRYCARSEAENRIKEA